MKQPDLQDIDVSAVRVFVHRTRQREEFEALKESIRREGLKQPIEVRDISHLPPSERRRQDGGFYKYELNFGEGRLTAARELEWKRIPAFIATTKEAETVGRFLAENILRKPLPWVEQARLVKADIDGGKSIEDVAREYVISEPYARKLLRVVSKTAHGLEAEVQQMPINEAEALIVLPAAHQEIVVQALRENPMRQVRDIIRKAQQVVETDGELSPIALKASLKRVDDELAKLRGAMKVVRLHYALGPQNLATLLEERSFRNALKTAGVSLTRFEQLSK